MIIETARFLILGFIPTYLQFYYNKGTYAYSISR